MALTGSAFLCLWNDFDPALADEYERWHTLEHVPERVASPGFLSGRRYADFGQSDGRYLTLYDLESMQALETSEYLDLQRNPTPWSARMRRYFRGFQRIPFETLASEGEGCASHIALIALETDIHNDRAAHEMVERLTLARKASQNVAFHVGRAFSVPAYGVFGLEADTNSERQRIIAIQEATTGAQAEELLSNTRKQLKADIGGVEISRAETTSLIFNVFHEDVVTRWRRPPAR